MAVTVTPAAPAATTSRHFLGSYGVHGADAFARAEAQRGKLVRISKLALSGTYATGGFALVPANFGLKEIQALAVIADGASGGAAVPQLTAPGASPVVKLVTDNVPTELANAASVTNHTYTCVIVGV